jgi:gluconolactonase
LPADKERSTVLEPLVDLSRVRVLVDDLDHPEGVAWGPDGCLYAGGEAGQIYRLSLQGAVQEVATTGGYALGLCLDAERNLYVCDSGCRAVMLVRPDGAVEVYADGCEAQRMSTPNYPVFDAAGNLYVSDSGDWDGRNGVLWVIHPGGGAELLRDDVSDFPNGLALSADGRWLYVVASQLPGVVRVELRNGISLGEPETVVELPGTVPDGLAFDVQGNLYISCYQPNRILRLAPDGALATLVEDPQGIVLFAPTNLAFCGADLHTLCVANLAARHLVAVDLSVAGQPCEYPRVG